MEHIEINMLYLQVKLEKNSVCSKWVDIVELISSQDIDVTLEDGTMASDEFLVAMDNYKKKEGNEQAGLVWRWLLGTTVDDPTVLLMTQALPCSLDVVNSSPDLRADHAMGMVVGKYPVLMDKFDDPSVLGPVPVYFSNDPEKTLKELKESPEYAYECLQALVSKLLARKELTR